MHKKVISFVNPNFQQGPSEFNAYYLPYSIGVLWSYASQFQEISSVYQLGEIIWRRDNLSDALDKVKNSVIVAFSTYVWNKSYNYALAKRIKEQYPNILIVFGGPEPPIQKVDIFERFPFIDIVVKQEGELTFKEILDHYPLGNYENVPGIQINKSGKIFNTAVRQRIEEIDVIPSPYTTGVFDKIMKDNPTVEWNSVLETNRGCPYQCTFCDWGSLTYNKVKKFDLERVKDELEWMGRNKIGFISIADANFGIFPERDSIIADKLIEIQQRYKCPNAYTISWAKNQKKEVISIVKKLINNGARMGLTVSVQSLSEVVLDNIKRKNLGINQIEDIFDQCDKENIPLITELILGLPGETLASWKENYYRLYRSNNHTGITTYNAQILENAEMNIGQTKLFRIESAIVRDYLCGANNDHELAEGVFIVKSTRDMPHERLLEALLFTWFMNTFHINGISNIISRFAYKHGNTDYRDFYEELYEWLLEDSWFAKEVQDTTTYYREWFANGEINHPKVGSTDVYGMNLGQRTSISIHTDARYDLVFGLLETYYRVRFPDHQEYVDDLFTIQKNYFVRFDQIKQYPRRIMMKHNILGYIQQDASLDAPSEYLFEFQEDTSMNLTRFCESLWFGRRRNFGKASVTYT
jgi:tRNA A37 methylthiotransferase MiaB